MPLAAAREGSARFEFPSLSRDTFLGLPGLLADALPDRYGNSLIDAWLARQGRSPGSFSPVERLCYVGRRAVGALEFSPALHKSMDRAVPIEIAELLALAQKVSDERAGLRADLGEGSAVALQDIIRVGTSAGGARPKAVIALNEATGEIRSGQVDVPGGFEHWLLKFDGINDSGLGDPAGYGRIEYAYSLMAGAARIVMEQCRLLEEGGRAHFMTRRFDRGEKARKIHLQSLSAIGHFDFNAPGSCSYEQAFQAMREMSLFYPDMEQQYRRMVFNVLARNQDDHSKNIAFLMDEQGRWRLSPAFDVIYSYNPDGLWTGSHQMSIRGKRDDFSREDLIATGREAGIRKPGEILDEVAEAVSGWPRFARDAGVGISRIELIGATFRRLS